MHLEWTHSIDYQPFELLYMRVLEYPRVCKHSDVYTYPNIPIFKDLRIRIHRNRNTCVCKGAHICVCK